MHSTQPPVRKGAVVVAIASIVVMICVLAWAINLAISHLMTTLA